MYKNTFHVKNLFHTHSFDHEAKKLKENYLVIPTEMLKVFHCEVGCNVCVTRATDTPC